MVALLASYPRSGNHLVRAFLEAKSGQPTYGCRRNPDDSPIRDRFLASVSPFPRRSDKPVAQKIHWIREKLEIQRDGLTISRFCLIVRDPGRCLISQMNRSLENLSWRGTLRAKRRLAKPDYVAQKTILELERWVSLVDHYIASDLPKLAISFEALISENRLSEVNDRLLPFFGINERFENLAELDHVGGFGRESQMSKIKKLPEATYLANIEINAQIRHLVDYQALRRRIGAEYD